MNEEIKMHTATVKMEVTTTVVWPVEVELDDEGIMVAAMSAVTQSHEVACGRMVDERANRIAWARVFAEVSDNDCEIEDRTDKEQ